jgi:hypothetical protein
MFPAGTSPDMATLIASLTLGETCVDLYKEGLTQFSKMELTSGQGR